MSHTLTRQVSRFGLIGIVCTFVHTAVAFIAIGQLGWSQAVGNGCAFVAASSFGYLANTTWTFQADVSSGTLARYLIVCLIGLGLSVLVGWSAEQRQLHYVVGITAVVLIMPVANFLLHRHWTYA